MEHRRFGCFFLHPVQDIIGVIRGIKYDSQCFIFSAQTQLKQVLKQLKLVIWDTLTTAFAAPVIEILT